MAPPAWHIPAVAMKVLLACLLAGNLALSPARAAGEAGARFPLTVLGSRLIDARGQEFRVIGDAPWTMIVALTPEEADSYLAARKAAGFNTILVELVERSHVGPRDRNGNLPFPGDSPFTAPSEEYFQHAQAILDLALKHDFLVLLSHAYLGYRCGKNGWCNEMLRASDADLEAYGRYVGTLLARYPNLIWVHGGDVDARIYKVMGKVEAVYRGVAAALPGAMHTAHCSRNFSAIDCYDRPWLTVNTTYSDCEQTPVRVILDRRRAADMPSIYIEGRYEEEKSTPVCIRSQLWWSYLGGSVGHVFGNKRIWLFEPDWRDALDTPGARAMTVASKLLARLQVSSDELVPQSLADSPLHVDIVATAWARAREMAYPRKLAWATVVDRPVEIPVAGSARATVAYLPYRTRFSYSGAGDVLCWIDSETGVIRPVTDDASAIESPSAEDWLFVAEKGERICAGNSL